MKRNNVMATEKYKLEEKNSNKIYFLPLHDLSSNSKTSSITAVDFFHVCFCSVSTLNHFVMVGALKHHHFTLLQMLSHSGENIQEWPAPGCLSTQTFSPFTAA